MTQENDVICVEDIMDEIRAKLRAEALAASIPSFSTIPMEIDGEEKTVDETQYKSRLRYLNAHARVSYERTGLGSGWKQRVKRVLYKILRCIILPIVEEQSEWNINAVDCFYKMQHQMDELKKQNQKLQEDVQFLRQQRKLK